MQSPDLAIKELRRCVQDLGFVGIQIGSHINDWNLDAPELFPIFEVPHIEDFMESKIFIFYFRNARGLTRACLYTRGT